MEIKDLDMAGRRERHGQVEAEAVDLERLLPRKRKPEEVHGERRAEVRRAGRRQTVGMRLDERRRRRLAHEDGIARPHNGARLREGRAGTQQNGKNDQLFHGRSPLVCLADRPAFSGRSSVRGRGRGG